MTSTRARRVAALTLTAVTAACLLAACGSSSSSSSASSSASAAAGGAGAGAAGGTADRTKLVACLKQHGVTLPSHPAGGSGAPPSGAGGGSGGSRPGFFGGGGAGAHSNPKFAAALKACGGGQGLARRGGAITHATITKFVTCVGQHGYDLPAPNFSGKGPVFPAKIESNKKFQSASRACASDLRPPAGSAPGAGSSTTSGA
jgi:hypothetical protein